MHTARTRVLDPFHAAAWWLLAAAALGLARPAGAQSADETPLFTPDELEELVAPIALYPDDLVAIVLPAATYPLDVVEAARLLDELEADPSLEPDDEWDDSIVALLNYPEVLRLMDEDLDWTWDLGEAFLNQQPEVFDAIQRFRVEAREAGNLASDERQLVTEREGAIRIAPADPKVIYVPYYEPQRIIVHHHVPIRYYPRPYPVYYYPYPAGYSFWSDSFWGVTTAFVIGWHTHHLHVHGYLHVGHPYYRHSYYDPLYVRRSISINVVSIDRDVYVWQPRHHRIGVRPGRVTVSREGVVRDDYGTRRYVTRGGESRRTVSTGGTSRRSVSTSSERAIGRIAATEQRTVTRGAAASSRSSAASTRGNASTGRRAATSSSGAAENRGRVTTREGIVNALREAGNGNAGSSAASRSSSSSASRSSASRSSASIGGIATSRGGGIATSRGGTATSRSTRRETAASPRSSRSAAESRLSQPTSRSILAAPSRSSASTSRSTATSRRATPSTSRSTATSSRATSSTSRSTATSSRATPSTNRSSRQPSTRSSSRSTSSVRSSTANRSSRSVSRSATRRTR